MSKWLNVQADTVERFSTTSIYFSLHEVYIFLCFCLCAAYPAVLYHCDPQLKVKYIM